MKNTSIRMLLVLTAVLAFLAVCQVGTWTASASAGALWSSEPNDPNEPEPEMVPLLWLDDEPNEPEPEMVPLLWLDDEPNEPEPERT